MGISLDSDQLAARWEFAATFSSRLAHDLSNIFTGVNGFSELAFLHMANDHPSRAYVKDVIQSGHRGIQLSQRMHLLRTCGTPQTGRTPVATAINQAEASHAARVPAGLVVEKEIPADLPPARLGSDPLKLAIGQLFENAAEAAGQNGRVRIEARLIELAATDVAMLYGRVRPGPHVEIRVIDNGPGIPDGLLTRVLETPLTTSRSGSRGFGLAIVFRVVYAHEGGFSLERIGERGAVARLCLPVS